MLNETDPAGDADQSPPATVTESGGRLVLVVPVLLLALGATMLGLSARQLDYLSDSGGPGPGFLPAWVGGALVVVALIDLVGSVRRGPPRVADEGASQEAPPTRLRELLPWPAIALLAMIASAIVLMRYVGAVLALVGLVFAIMRWLQRETVLRSLLTGIVTAGAIYVVFEVALDTPIPHGVFGQ